MDTTLTAHLTVGDTFEIPVPGTGMKQWREIEVVALPGDENFHCGGDPEPHKFVVVRQDGGAPHTIHADYLAPKWIR